MQIVDLDPLDLTAQSLDDTGQQIVGERPRRGIALQATVDGHRLRTADDDGEFPLPIDLLEPDELLVLHLADDDLVQFHLDGHRRLRFCF